MINVTELTEYLYCPRKLYIKKTLGLKEPFTKAMLQGKLKHDILDLFNKNESSLVSGIIEKINLENLSLLYQNLLRAITIEVFRKNWRALETYEINKNEFYQNFFNNIKEDINLRISSILKNQENFLGKELWNNLNPKYLTELKIESEVLDLKGRIDRVEFSDEIIPYEVKNREDIFESDRIQLAAYSLLLKEEFNRDIKKGIIKTKTKTEEIIIDDELKNKVLYLIEQVKKISETKPEILSNFKKCSSCPFRDKCLEI